MDDISNMAGAALHQNGVSQFMAQVKRELGVLQNVLSASGVSTQYLQSVGQDVLSPAGKINGPNLQAEPKIAASEPSTPPILTSLGRNSAHHSPSITDNSVEPAQQLQPAILPFQDRVENAFISPMAVSAGISRLPAQNSAVFAAPAMQVANIGNVADVPGAVAPSPASAYAPTLAEAGQFIAPPDMSEPEGTVASVAQFSNAPDAAMAWPQS